MTVENRAGDLSAMAIFRQLPGNVGEKVSGTVVSGLELRSTSYLQNAKTLFEDNRDRRAIAFSGHAAPGEGQL
jgi:hypothetical protein